MARADVSDLRSRLADLRWYLEIEIEQEIPAPVEPAPAPRKRLSAPKRAAKKVPAADLSASELAVQRARELALAIAIQGLEKKAMGIEILDVARRIDYADFVVVMTGRSDRHVHAIAIGIEDGLRSIKARPLSITISIFGPLKR